MLGFAGSIFERESFSSLFLYMSFLGFSRVFSRVFCGGNEGYVGIVLVISETFAGVL